jgi:hypothetical protein
MLLFLRRNCGPEALDNKISMAGLQKDLTTHATRFSGLLVTESLYEYRRFLYIFFVKFTYMYDEGSTPLFERESRYINKSSWSERTSSPLSISLMTLPAQKSLNAVSKVVFLSPAPLVDGCSAALRKQIVNYSKLCLRQRRVCRLFAYLEQNGLFPSQKHRVRLTYAGFTTGYFRFTTGLFQEANARPQWKFSTLKHLLSFLNISIEANMLITSF